MSSINAPTYDPTSTAQAMAQKATAAAQSILTKQTKSASAISSGLSKLSSAISAFQSSLASLTGIGQSVLAQSAVLSDTTIGSATAKPQAAAGAYSLFVQQIATSSQVSYNNLSNGATPGGTLKLVMSDESAGTTTSSFNIDLSAAADTDKDGKLSILEVAAAINHAPGNVGQVSAGVVTIGTDTRLVLSSKKTGVANTISLDASGVTDATLKSGLGTRQVVTTAQDAIMLLGGKTGTPIKQSSNTFTNIDGVSVTFTRAQSASENPITLTVVGDNAGTVKNVQAFVDAYNKLQDAIDPLVYRGDPAGEADGTINKNAGAFAHDAGIEALRRSLADLLRPTGGVSLASYGITADRTGTLTLDQTRLNKVLAVDPNGLDTLIGSASSSKPSGIAGSLTTYLNQWTNSATGQLKTRGDANAKLQSTLSRRQTDLDAQYDASYKRYLKQFTELQTLQSSMSSNLSLFDALFGNDKSS
jgi:flagellar hook-associated protein 2